MDNSITKLTVFKTKEDMTNGQLDTVASNIDDFLMVTKRKRSSRMWPIIQSDLCSLPTNNLHLPNTKNGMKNG